LPSDSKFETGARCRCGEHRGSAASARPGEAKRQWTPFTPVTSPMESALVTPPALSAEVREKPARVRRITLGQAAHFPGLAAAVVSLLLIHPKRRRSNRPGAPRVPWRRGGAGASPTLGSPASRWADGP